MATAWADLTSSGLSARVNQETVAILPLAAIEQHGPHLPLATDQVIADGLTTAALPELPAGVDCLRLPTLAIGDSLEHGRHSGTLSLSAETLQAVLVDIGHSIARAGCRRLVLYSSHGGNLAAVDTAALRLRAEAAMLVVKTCHFDFPPLADALPEREWQEGLHGGALETALMLHLAPERVDTAALAHWPSLEFDALAGFQWLGAENRPARFAWLAQDLHPAGVSGDARLASAQLGQRLLAHYAATLAAIIAETAAFPLAQLR